MTEHSDAAKAAYPDNPHTGTTPFYSRVQRTAYDRGAATTYAVTREALAELLLNATEPWSTPGQIADAVLASDALVDVNEVKAEALEEAADDIQALHPGEVKASVERLRERAAGIRAGRP